MDEPREAPLDTTLDLLARAKAGDREALDSLFEQALPPLRRWARGRLPRWARGLMDTDDLVQETAVRAIARIGAFERPGEDRPAGHRGAAATSPSGGARHPIELYALVLGVEGVPRGLHHYRCDRHALELIDSDVPARPVERYLPNQPWFSNASALILFTAVFPRIGWRYAHARAYRAALIEAGHQCQTFCLTATSLGLAPFCSMALADSCIEQDLAIDGITESVLYAAGVGTRPTGLGWIAPPIEGPAPPPLTRQQERRFPGQISRRTANR